MSVSIDVVNPEAARGDDTTLSPAYEGEEYNFKDGDNENYGGTSFMSGESFDQSFMEGAEGAQKRRKKKNNTLGDDFMDHTWQVPDKELAMKRGIEAKWQGGKRNMGNTGVSDFGDMSDGMELYFYTIKNLALLFGVLSLLSVPLLVIAYAGNTPPDGEPLATPGANAAGFVAEVTLGNVGACASK